MSRYIDAEALKHILNASKYYGTKAGRDFADMIVECDSADVKEVRHGRWIKDDETGEPICSVCKSGKPTKAACSSVIEHKLSNRAIKYCYYCGARMVEE